ncbi:lactamase [Mucidula mucida]|nr:lactamase [Mucidula mucida]
MDKLEALASITRLSDNVVRVLGQNPGKFTLQGTNTYIVGSKNPYTLIDTGEGRDDYIPVLESALRETASLSDPQQQHISDIVISHWHHDHVGGIPAVLSLLRRLWDETKPGIPFKPPRMHKFPIPEGKQLQSHSSVTLPSILESLPPNSFFPSLEGNPFHDLIEGQSLNNLQILHTPGHTVDSVCLYLPFDRALYTADTVLGQGTAVFEDLSTYISSLRKMLDFGAGNGMSYDVLYPGHGPVVQSGKDTISTYIQHRLERETQILEVLRSSPSEMESSASDSNWTTWTLVARIYAAYPENLWLPAAHGVNLHLRKLEQDGVVTKLGGDGVHTSWAFIEASKGTL